jgi:hypothetical protein
VEVTRTKVKVNEEVQFVLPPGGYVLDVGASWISVEVAVRPGETSVKDIPGTCL